MCPNLNAERCCWQRSAAAETNRLLGDDLQA
jgi:hypothetical protein